VCVSGERRRRRRRREDAELNYLVHIQNGWRSEREREERERERGFLCSEANGNAMRFSSFCTHFLFGIDLGQS